MGRNSWVLKKDFLIIIYDYPRPLVNGKRECYRKGRNIKYRRDESIMVRDNREAETEMERRRRRRKAEKLRGLKRRRRRLVLAILAVLFLPIIGARIYFGVNPVILKNSVIDVELKDSVNLKKNIRYVFAGKASQVKITGSVDNTKEGDYRVTYSWRGRKKTVTVKVRDTKPPVLEMKNSYTVDLGGAVTADDFVKKVKDASEVSLKILNAKKWDKAGEYSISVEAKDIYGNKTTGKSKLILEEDKTPPEISGAEDTEILQGKTMDFSSGVTVKCRSRSVFKRGFDKGRPEYTRNICGNLCRKRPFGE